MKTIKNLILEIKNKIDLKRKKFDEYKNKQRSQIENLPEKVNTDLTLNKILSFGFIFRIGLIILFLIYLGYIAINSLSLIYAILIAFVISVSLEKSIIFFQKYLPRSVSIILVYIIFFFFLVLSFFVFIPFILNYIDQIIQIINSKVVAWQYQIQNESLEQVIKSFHLYPYVQKKLLVYASNPEIANKIKEILTVNISNILQVLGNYMTNISSFVFSTLLSIFSIISRIIIVFILSIFFSFEKDKVVLTLARLSESPRKTALKLEKLYYQLGEWLKGQMLLSIFVGVSVYLGLLTLALFGINLNGKLELALIASLTEFIPYIGAILRVLPAILVAILNYGFQGFVSVIILYIIIGQVENLIIPIIMNKALGINSLLIIIMMLVGMKVMGIAGSILAIPLAVIVSLLFEDSLKNNKVIPGKK